VLLRLKKIIWVFFIAFDFCVLAVAAGGAFYLESDGPRVELEKILSSQMGRDVRFQDNFDLNFYPWLGVDTGPVTVSAPENSSYPHQLTVKDINLKVRLLPLLSGELEVDTIIVDSPSLHVDRLKDGSLNLPVFDSSETEKERTSGERYFNRISVRGASILNATCAYNDVGSGNSFRVSGINVRTGLLRKGTPLAFEISAILDAELFSLKAEANLKGLVDFSLRQKRVALSDTSLALKLESKELLGAKESVDGIASLDFDLIEGRVDVTGLVLQGAGIRLSGSANCTDIYHAPDFKGRLKSTRFDPKKVFSKFTPVPIPSAYKDILNVASFEMNFHSTLEKTELSNMVLAVDHTVIKGDFSLKDYSNPWLEFDVRADSVVFDPYEKLFDLEKKSIEKDSAPENGGGPGIKSFRDMVIADMVRKIPCNGKLEVDHFVYDGIRLNNAELSLSPGPEVASLSVGKGSYLDGDFGLSVGLKFSDKEKGVLYLNGQGSVSPFSLSRLSQKIQGLNFRAGKASFKLSGLTSRGRTPGELVRNLKLDSRLEGLGVVADLSFKGVPDEMKKVHAEKTAVSLHLSPLGSDISRDMVGRKLALKLSGAMLEPAGVFNGSFHGGLLCSRNDLSDIEIRDGKLDFSIGGKGVPVIKKNVSLSISGGGGLRSGNLKLDNFAFKSGKIDLNGNIDAHRLGSETAAAVGVIKLPETDCSEFFDLFGISKPETNDPNAFDTVELDSSFQLNGENLTFRVNKCSLDDAAANGTFQISDFKNPFLHFVIKADKVDVDHFLPPQMQKLSKDSVNPGAGDIRQPEWQFPDEFLGAVNATGKVECNYFRIFDFGAGKISADVDMQNAIIDIHNMKADFHEGSLAGRLELGLKNGTVSLGTDVEARGFQAGLFFVDYVGRDYVTGKTDASLEINGRSTANIDFVDTLSGGIAFKIVDGSYLFAAPPKKNEKEKKKPSPTSFSVMKGVINGKDGKFKVVNYLLKTIYLTATAKGGFSFPDNSINMQVNADIIKLPNLYLRLVNTFLDAMTGVNVEISGKLSNPRVKVNGLERWSDLLGDVLGIPERSFMFFRKLIF
jgi:AsmA protein